MMRLLDVVYAEGELNRLVVDEVRDNLSKMQCTLLVLHSLIGTLYLCKHHTTARFGID